MLIWQSHFIIFCDFLLGSAQSHKYRKQYKYYQYFTKIIFFKTFDLKPISYFKKEFIIHRGHSFSHSVVMEINIQNGI